MHVLMKTSEGEIEIRLFEKEAPETVKNFLSYVDSGFYSGTIFHRVIEDFMIQGGGFTEEMEQKPAISKVENEADNGVSNKRGSIAMARTQDPHSASSQFFINVKDNSFLDHRDKSPSGWGYCVFGEVCKGMEVVDLIRGTETGSYGFHGDVPTKPIIIHDLVRL